MTSLQQVKKYYKDSKEVRCLANNKVYDISGGVEFREFNVDLFRNIYFLRYDSEGFATTVWLKIGDKLAPILSFIDSDEEDKEEAEEELKGVKTDSHKVDISVLFKQFPRALTAVAEASAYGHNKYRETDKDMLNFTRVENAESRYRGALMRHERDRYTDGYLDSESNLPHIYHKAWNALAELEMHLKNIDNTF